LILERFNLSDFKEGKYPIESDIYCKKILQSSKTENFHEEKLKSSIVKLKKGFKERKNLWVSFSFISSRPGILIERLYGRNRYILRISLISFKRLSPSLLKCSVWISRFVVTSLMWYSRVFEDTPSAIRILFRLKLTPS